MRSTPLIGGFGCATSGETDTLVSSKTTVLCLNDHHLNDRVMCVCVLDCIQKKGHHLFISTAVSAVPATAWQASDHSQHTKRYAEIRLRPAASESDPISVCCRLQTGDRFILIP